MQTVRVQKDFAAPRERVFAYLAEHENLGTVFAPARVEHVRDGENGRGGVGSVRKLSVAGLMPFEETVTAFVPDERIEYRITKGAPIRDHSGTIEFTPTGAGGTHLEWTIRFDAPVPGMAAAVAAGLRRIVARGLGRAAETL